ncbi:hypothetical protein SacmaDRAFT_1164 [Saccharomonospora marina XMU15]|uniref:Transmembrane protein n=1 Tax=Saccharomonospora marina XMU15 TaxID=882083 RepID=H5WXB8_9PSEU|nr:hypothetical protein [Saccharomonospora marina]EHR49447.1 hypothetical protein SacmaDRAFT_1164 [Saccharomonospora marina XMU15]
MSRERSGDNPMGLYTREIRMALRNNSGAYGFTVTVTCSVSMLSVMHTAPSPLHIFLFVFGAVASFFFVEMLATRLFRRSLGGDEKSNVVALGSSLGVFSISLAVGATALTAFLLPVTLSWFVGSFAASVTYLLVNALEMDIARRLEEARNVA